MGILEASLPYTAQSVVKHRWSWWICDLSIPFPFPTWKKSKVLFCGWGENKGASQEKKGLSQQLCWAARLSSWQSNRPCPNSRLENKPAQDILTENSQEDPDSDLEIPHPENKSKPAKRTTNLVWDRNSSLFEIMLTAGVGRREGSREGVKETEGP